MMRILITMIVLFFSTACTTNWTKGDVTQAELNSDIRGCEYSARKEANSMYSIEHSNLLLGANAMKYAMSKQSCMFNKGYYKR